MERLFQNSRFLVIIAIITTAISSLLVYITCVNIVFNVVKTTLISLPDSAKGGKEMIVELLKILDLLLIGITLQVITISLYRLFISPATTKSSQFLAAFPSAMILSACACSSNVLRNSCFVSSKYTGITICSAYAKQSTQSSFRLDPIVNNSSLTS